MYVVYWAFSSYRDGADRLRTIHQAPKTCRLLLDTWQEYLLSTSVDRENRVHHIYRKSYDGLQMFMHDKVFIFVTIRCGAKIVG